MSTDNEKRMGRPPAGGRPGDTGQQAGIASAEGQQAGSAVALSTPSPCAELGELGVIVANDRDRRTLAWLREQVGDAAIMAAVGQLAGKRRPYLSNLAKVLGVALPERLEVADRDVALRRIATLRANFRI